MNINTRITVFTFLILGLSAAAHSAEAASETTRNLKGKHHIELALGYHPVSEEADHYDTLSIDSHADDVISELRYSYWISDRSAFSIRFGTMCADAEYGTEDGNFKTNSSAIVAMLAGLTYTPDFFHSSENGRFYLEAAVGPYWGSNDETVLDFGNNRRWSVETGTDAEFGGYVGVGYLAFLSKHFTLRTSAGYHFVSAFDEPVGSVKDASGAEFSIAIGWMWGGN